MRNVLLKVRMAFALVLALLVLVMSVSAFAGDGTDGLRSEAGDVETVGGHLVKIEPEGSGTVLLVTKTGEPVAKTVFLEGEEVCFKVLPSEGYAMRAIWVKDAFGADVEYSWDDICSFFMPAADVMIRAVFEEVKKAEVVASRKEATVPADEDDMPENPEGSAEDGTNTVGNQAVSNASETGGMTGSENASDLGDASGSGPEDTGNETLTDRPESESVVEPGSTTDAGGMTEAGGVNEPGSVSESDDASDSGKVSDKVSGDVPNDMSGDASDAVPGHVGRGTEMESLDDPKNDLGMTPEADPETDPKKDLGITPRVDPERDPGVDQEASSAIREDGAAADAPAMTDAPARSDAPTATDAQAATDHYAGVLAEYTKESFLEFISSLGDEEKRAFRAGMTEEDVAFLYVLFEGDALLAEAVFERDEEDLYFISEDFDYSPYIGLDYSSMRLIVGTNTPSVLVDASVVISQLNGLYLLQFTDVETTMKAYVYYLLHTPLVEIDGKVMAVNGEGSVQGDIMGRDIMTEGSNPFAQVQEAVFETGYGAYDIALIDTGANGYVANAVSVVGDYAGDDNGHGTRMAQLIAEQDPSAKILSIKAFESNGMADLSAIYAAFQYAMTQNVRIIHISATAVSVDSSILLSAISSVAQSGCMVVASAGNNGRDASWFVPAGLPGVITIGACDETGARLPGSNYGDCVEYNVVASSTSEAAAKFTGWLSANSLDTVADVLNKGLIYQTDYDHTLQTDDDPVLADLLELLNTGPSMEAVDRFLQQLSAIQAQNLYLDLSWEDMQTVIQLYLDDLEQDHDTYTALELVSQRMKERFCLEYFLVTTMDGELVSYDQAGGTVFRGGEVLFGDTGDVSAGCYGMNTSSGHFYAFCALSSVAASPRTTGTANALSNDVLTKIYLVSPSGPYYSTYKGEIFNNILSGIKNSNAIRYAGGTTMDSRDDQTKDYVLAHVMISGVFSGDWGNDQSTGASVWTSSHKQDLQNAVNRINELIPDDDPYMQNAKTYWMLPGNDQGKTYQSMLWVEANYGFLKLKKASSDPSAGYSLAGATYAVYNSSNEPVGTLTTDANGDTEPLFLPAGSYTVIETQAPENYQVDQEAHAAQVEMYETTTLNVTDIVNPPKGKVTVRKASASSSITNGNTNYSLEGAVYGLYTNASCTNEYARGTTNASGMCSFTDLPLGTYYVKEISASRGYQLDTVVKTVPVNSEAEIFVDSSEAPITGRISLSKASAVTSITNNNGCYSLEGAVYSIYRNAACTDLYKTITTNSSGTASADNVPLGTYYIKETTASAGFGLADCHNGGDKLHVVTLTSSNTTSSFTCNEPVKAAPVQVLVHKVDDETGRAVPQGAGTLAGAEYTVKYYTNYNYSGSPARTWVLVTSADGQARLSTTSLKAGSDALYLSAGGSAVIPMGSFTIEETKVPAGYKKDPSVYRYQVNGSGIGAVSADGSIYPIGTTPALQTDQGVTSEEAPVRGGLRVTKLITDTSDNKDGNVDISGIRFAVVLSTGKNQQNVTVPAGGTSYAPGQVVQILTTNANGVAQTGQKDLPYGYYDVYELSKDSSVSVGAVWTSQEAVTAGKLANNTGVLYNALHTQIFVDADNVYKEWNVKNDVVFGYARVIKNDADRAANTAQGDASFEGIRYAIVNRSANKVSYPAGTTNGTIIQPGSVVDILTTNANGQITSGKLPYGTYDVIELRADAAITKGAAWSDTGSSIYANNKGYLYKAQTQSVTVSTYGVTYDTAFTDEVVRGGVKIQKILEELNAAENEGFSSLAGVTFSVVNASDADVYVNGTWYGHIQDKGAEVSAATNSASVTDTGYTRAQMIEAVRGSDAIVASITTDAMGQTSLGADTLPYGTYYIYEESSNASMLVAQDWVLRIEVREEGEVIDASSLPAKDPLVRGDLNFKKVDIDGEFRGNIPFLIMAYDASGNVLESHVIVSDANGDINTAVRDNTDHTNGMDAFVAYDEMTGQYAVTAEGEELLSSGEAATYGIWFSCGLDPQTGLPTGNEAPADDSRGALYYGNYRIFEIKCRDNEDKGEDLLKSSMIPVMEKTTKLDAHGRVVSESSDKTVNFRTFVDLEVGLTSEATDTITGTHVAALSREAVVSDSIHYTHLKANSTYKWIVDFVLTDEPSTILSKVVVDGYVPARSSANVQTAEGTFTVSIDGTISGDLTGTPSVSSTGTIDTTVLQGRQISAIVYLYGYTEGYDFDSGSAVEACDFIISHNVDVKDQNEMLYVPSMRTTATDAQTGDHVGTKSAGSGIIDTVTMTGLIPGGYYMLEATVMDQSTGEAHAAAEPVTKTFYSGWSSSGAVPLMVKTMPAILIDPSEFAEKTLTIYEALWRADDEGNKLDEQPVMIHEELLDEDQSIHYMDIDTNAVDTSTGDHVGQASREAGGTTTVKDTVHVTNMIPGMEYTIKGKLVYKNDGTDANGIAHTAGEEIPALDGSETELTFIAQDDTGIFTIVYVVDSSALEGLSAVSTEYAYHNDVEVAAHADLEDEDQTVHFPKILTTLRDSENGEHDAFPDSQISLVDTVIYSNLVPGLPYTLTGVLYNKATGEKALDDDGKEITSEAVFIPESANGTQDLTFTFSGGSLTGISLVAFETLTHNDVDVARHQDIEDEEQTVHIPKIGTTLADSIDGEHDAMASGHMELTDHVTYENLLPGEEYVVKGILMDQETGKKALDDNGNEIKAETTFTAKTKDGAADVSFLFSGESLKDHTVVAFEELYHKDKKIAEHTDIKDEAQIIWLPKVTTTLEDTVDGNKDALAAKDIILQDTVYYENVRIGQEYEVQGYLVDKETGKPAKDDHGKIIENRISFTAKETAGTILVKFPFSGESLKGKTLIAFEILYRNGKAVASHCIIEDFDQSVFLPKIATVLKNSEGGKVVYAKENVTLIDTVDYENLMAGETYEVRGVLMDKETGKPALDDNGKEIHAKTIFEPAAANGSAEVVFAFRGTKLEGKSLVAFEDLYREGKHVAVHANINDMDQTVTAPSILTTLVNQGGVKTVRAGGQVTLTDTIIYKGLIPGHTYLAKGRLMIQSTGRPMLDASGNEVTAERSFVPEAADGSVDVTFAFEMPAGISWRLVAFETLFEGGTEAARHEDLQDEAQIVNVLSLRTKASFQNSAKKAPDHEAQTVIDKISYDCLEPGVYTIKTALMNKADGSPVTENGVPVQRSTTVKLKKASGTVSVAITVPAGTITGSAVVFEEFLKTGPDGQTVVVGEHKDLQDDAQTVTFYHIQVPAKKYTPVRTGDETGTLIWVVCALAAITALFTCIFILGKRRNR